MVAWCFFVRSYFVLFVRFFNLVTGKSGARIQQFLRVLQGHHFFVFCHNFFCFDPHNLVALLILHNKIILLLSEDIFFPKNTLFRIDRTGFDFSGANVFFKCVKDVRFPRFFLRGNIKLFVTYIPG